MSILLKIWKEFILSFKLLLDYYKGNYTNISLDSLAMILIMFFYVILPLDFILDFIPILGWIDDLLIVWLVLIYVKMDLRHYSRWKKESSSFT